MAEYFDILVIGGGIGGIAASARLRRLIPALKIGIVEPSGYHLYQPQFTFIAAGFASQSSSVRPMEKILPKGCIWIRDAVRRVVPSRSEVVLSSGKSIGYRILIVASGLTLDTQSIEGLDAALNEDCHPLCSIYEPSTHEKCSSLLNGFKGGTLLFSLPLTPVKCPVAPLKILFLADDILRRRGVRELCKIVFITPFKSLFEFQGFAQTINRVVRERDIEVIFGHEVRSVDSSKRLVYLQSAAADDSARETLKLNYDFAHITPPMKPAAFIRESGLSHSGGLLDGWMSVDLHTLRHTAYDNIFGLGDVAGLPNMKTATAARAQSAVIAENVRAIFQGRKDHHGLKQYDGYSACPIVTGIGECMQAGVRYDGTPIHNFSADPFKPSTLMWHFNRTLLPKLYWAFHVRGFG